MGLLVRGRVTMFLGPSPRLFVSTRFPSSSVHVRSDKFVCGIARFRDQFIYLYLCGCALWLVHRSQLYRSSLMSSSVLFTPYRCEASKWFLFFPSVFSMALAVSTKKCLWAPQILSFVGYALVFSFDVLPDQISIRWVLRWFFLFFSQKEKDLKSLLTLTSFCGEQGGVIDHGNGLTTDDECHHGHDDR